MFDTTISLGSLLTIASLIVIVTIYILTVKQTTAILGVRLKSFGERMENVEVELKKLTEVLINQALLGGRIDRVEDRQLAEGRRLDELQTRINRSADKDYPRTS